MVDVMGRLNTLDGERIVGMVNSQSDYSSVIFEDFAQGAGTGPVRPIGMNNLALGGATIGFTPGIVGDPGHALPDSTAQSYYNAIGLNNIGLMVKIWGMVTESGSSYSLDQNHSQPWMRIDDGSSVASGNSAQESQLPDARGDRVRRQQRAGGPHGLGDGSVVDLEARPWSVAALL